MKSAELSLHLQAKLLRVLQEKCVVPVGDFRARPVDIRVISATNQPLESMVREGTFRQDLFFRLNVVVLKLPPLRDRRLTSFAWPNISSRRRPSFTAKPSRTLAPQTMATLQDYSWPGNVRELVERDGTCPRDRGRAGRSTSPISRRVCRRPAATDRRKTSVFRTSSDSRSPRP